MGPGEGGRPGPALSPGAKYYEWERKGVPFRIEVGPKDLAKGQVALAKRVRAADAPRKEFLPEGQALSEMAGRLDTFQDELLAAARARREANSHRGVSSFDEAVEILETQGASSTPGGVGTRRWRSG
jgi:prolyl-tRNA synthetase